MIGTILGGRYEILEEVGKGGMAYVYKAHCHMLNRTVAVKVLRNDLEGGDEFVQRFNTEAQSAAGLTHPKKNIITRAVGSDEIVDIDIFKNELSKDDVILLCTDGLYGLVNEEEIKEVLNGDIENAATKLVDMANENGGKDNISAIIIRNEVKA